ncbi:MAG: hypothetical protein JKY27_09105 [Magnetovibrio sp.]|nr:hypothetical protein [Magnetovibrio sp.]
MSTKHADHANSQEVLKAQRMMVLIFGFATLMPTLWMLMIAWSGFSSAQSAPSGSEEFLGFVIYWGLAAPLIWLGANVIALTKIYKGNGDSAKLFPLIPAFWSLIWFASQLSG